MMIISPTCPHWHIPHVPARRPCARTSPMPGHPPCTPPAFTHTVETTHAAPVCRIMLINTI
ncbi:hypothetical protein BJV78DRAFT_1271980, partial [Lactifluus subvellereus]